MGNGLFVRVRTPTVNVALLAVFLLAGLMGYQAYLASPRLQEAEPQPTTRPALARRTVLFIIDGFAPGHGFDPAVMPTMAGLAARGASGIAQTGPVTTTAPCVFSLMTGRPGNLVQAIFNFHSAETRVDSLPSQIAATGKGVVLAGDDAWMRQFGWLTTPADTFDAGEPGISLDPKVRQRDVDTVDFLLARLADPRIGFAVAHLGSADAAGHMVTPRGDAYRTTLQFLDGQLARVVAAIDLDDTVLLVTGDHGMAARGTHGGEEEARLTPYVLVGPGVRAGTVADIPQTALPVTLSALLGLPFLPVSEHPPPGRVLALEPAAKTALLDDYFAAKRRAAGADAIAGEPQGALNDRLNQLLFGAADERHGLRLGMAALTMAGVVLALLLAWRSLPARWARRTFLPEVMLALAVPLALALVARALLQARGAFAMRSDLIAGTIAVTLLGTITAAVWFAWRRPGVLQLAVSRPTASVFGALVLLGIPLVNSHWMHPGFVFELLALALGCGLVARHAADGALPVLRLLAVAGLAATLMGLSRLPKSAFSAEGVVTLLAGLVLALAVNRLRPPAGSVPRVGLALLGVAFASAAAWRFRPSIALAEVVALSFLALVVVAAILARRLDGVRAGTVLVAASAAVFLVLAAERRELVVYLIATAGLLAFGPVRLALGRAPVFYAVALAAILVRLALYFQLGDQYSLSSIRTAPGFVLVSEGLPLFTVVACLLLKYALPWFLVLGALLPSLVAAGGAVTRHFLDVLALAYVARFALVAAVVDPMRTFPNGMNGIVGLFCLSWAELASFTIAATFVGLVVWRDATAPGRRGESDLTSVLEVA